MTAISLSSPNPLRWSGALLGFSLGGFFDGILLHQILQWHHLLSSVEAARDMRLQILADGLFHALMYLIAAAALYKLWRARSLYAQPGADATLWSHALMGFGGWHIADSVLSHWVTGIHRIRIDSANPLFWDLLWFFAFGVLPFVLGWMLRGRSRGGGDGRRGRNAATTLGLAALVAGPLAAVPPGDATEVMVLFRPGISSGAAFNALAEIDSRILWVDGSGGMWAVKLNDPGQASQLYRRGALLVSNSSVALGCFSWSRGGAG